MSWRSVPDSEKPPEALSGPGHGKGKGVGKQTLERSMMPTGLDR